MEIVGKRDRATGHWGVGCVAFQRTVSPGWATLKGET